MASDEAAWRRADRNALLEVALAARARARASAARCAGVRCCSDWARWFNEFAVAAAERLDAALEVRD